MIELLLEAERCLADGQPDRAEQLYRQVADADPHNSIAVVGLGRVAHARGDDLGAYLLARRALAIDPENEAARRLATTTEARIGSTGAEAKGGDRVGGESPGGERTGGENPATPDDVTPPATAPVPAATPPAPPVLADAPPVPTPAAARPTRRRRSFLDRLRRR